MFYSRQHLNFDRLALVQHIAGMASHRRKHDVHTRIGARIGAQRESVRDPIVRQQRWASNWTPSIRL